MSLSIVSSFSEAIMAANEIVVVAPASTTSNTHHATVEPADDSETLFDEILVTSRPTSSRCSSIPTSRNSTVDTEEEDEDVEDVFPNSQLCRRDGAHEVATSLWGIVPIKNFGSVMPGIYRSSFPKTENFAFMKTLGLKSILTLVDGQYSPEHVKFVVDNGIQHFQVKIDPNKDPFVTVPQCNMFAALRTILDVSNHPILIHCNKGKHRTGCVVGSLRKTMGWELAAVFQEYHHYADPKARVLDERYLELFDERAMLWLARENGFLPTFEPMNDSPIAITNMTTRLRG